MNEINVSQKRNPKDFWDQKFWIHRANRMKGKALPMWQIQQELNRYCENNNEITPIKSFNTPANLAIAS